MTALEAALKMVEMRVLIVDNAGLVWKQREIRNTGKLVLIPVRRAEQLNRKLGYLYVMVRHRSRQYNVPAHRLVWTVLKGPIPPGKEINHIDGSRAHNHPFNLELVTPSENIQHSYKVLGRRRQPRLAPEKIELARRLRLQGLSFSQIAKAAGISMTAAFNYCKTRAL